MEGIGPDNTTLWPVFASLLGRPDALDVPLDGADNVASLVCSADAVDSDT